VNGRPLSKAPRCAHRVQTYYQENGKWMFEPCGFSLLSSTKALTAAHCFDGQIKNYPDGIKAELVYMFINDFDTNQPDEDWRSKGKAVHIHPGYVKNTATEGPKNDIAIIELATPVDAAKLADGTVSLMCMSQSHDQGSTPVQVIGWGKLDPTDASMPHTPWDAHLTTMSTAECRDTKYTDEEINDTLICAAGEGDHGREDACQGDSGGPLFRVKDGKCVQLGVVSWGKGCAAEGFPGIYLRIPGPHIDEHEHKTYLDWIKSFSKDVCEM